jgi:hypothetical protein
MARASLNPEAYYPPAGLLFTDYYGYAAAFLMEYAGFVGLIVRLIGAI